MIRAALAAFAVPLGWTLLNPSAASAAPGRSAPPSAAATAAPAPPAASAGEASAPAAGSGAGSGTVLTRVVGEVADRIVTSREVQIADALERTLDGGPRTSSWSVLTGREAAFAPAVSRTLSEWAVYLESRAFSDRPAPRAEAQKKAKAAREAWAGRADFAKLEATEAELTEAMERKLVAREFVRLKSEASQAPITDADALSYFRRNRLKFGNLPFEDFRDNIKAFLAKQQSERRLKEWLDVLQRKYKTRNYVSG